MELSDVKKPENIKSYSTEQVAEFIGISIATMYRLIKDGRISGINIARTGKKPIWRFRPEDIQAYYDRERGTEKSTQASMEPRGVRMEEQHRGTSGTV